MRKSSFDSYPFVTVTDAAHGCAIGWDTITADLQRAIAKSPAEKPILVVDCYPSVDELRVLNELQTRLAPRLAIHAAEAYHSPKTIDKLVAPTLGREDRTFGRPSGLSLVNFFNAEPLWRFRRIIDELKDGLVLIVGCGASLIAWGQILVYAGLARREARRRLQHNDLSNLGVDNKSLPAELKHKHACFVDWPVADRWKRPLIKRWNYVLDTNNSNEPKLADAEGVRRGLRAAARQPFRLMSTFNPAAGDEQKREAKYSSTYSGSLLEENSLLLGFGDVRIEVPAIDLFFNQPDALLGESVRARFKGEFPIRSDFVDTFNRFEQLSDSGESGRLRDLSIIETNRHSFGKTVTYDTHGSINVLNLVKGDEAIVESPDRAFEPLIIHHAETFVVPAAVEHYLIRPHGLSAGKEIAIIRASVRIRI
jgi:hypothetical protein